MKLYVKARFESNRFSVSAETTENKKFSELFAGQHKIRIRQLLAMVDQPCRPMGLDQINGGDCRGVVLSSSAVRNALPSLKGTVHTLNHQRAIGAYDEEPIIADVYDGNGNNVGPGVWATPTIQAKYLDEFDLYEFDSHQEHNSLGSSYEVSMAGQMSSEGYFIADEIEFTGGSTMLSELIRPAEKQTIGNVTIIACSSENNFLQPNQLTDKAKLETIKVNTNDSNVAINATKETTQEEMNRMEPKELEAKVEVKATEVVETKLAEYQAKIEADLKAALDRITVLEASLKDQAVEARMADLRSFYTFADDLTETSIRKNIAGMSDAEFQAMRNTLFTQVEAKRLEAAQAAEAEAKAKEEAKAGEQGTQTEIKETKPETEVKAGEEEKGEDADEEEVDVITEILSANGI